MIIHTLKQQLNDAEFKVVIRALRQDAIIWSALQDEQFLNRIKTTQLTGLKPWTPANIALTYLFPNSAPRMLSALPNNLDTETKTRAAETLEALLSPTGSPDTEDELTTAALAAIALRERWLMLDTVEKAFFKQVPLNTQLWQTTLSILYGLMPHGGKILEALLHSQDDRASSPRPAPGHLPAAGNRTPIRCPAPRTIEITFPATLDDPACLRRSRPGAFPPAFQRPARNPP